MSHTGTLKVILDQPSTSLELGLTRHYAWPHESAAMMGDTLTGLLAAIASESRYRDIRVMSVSDAIQYLDSYASKGQWCESFSRVRAALKGIREQNVNTLLLWNETGVTA